MTISLADIAYMKSKNVTNLATNGGSIGKDQVLHGAKHSLLPRVTKSERISGVTRYRKIFWKNSNADNTPAYGVLNWMETPSNADDRIYLARGTHDDDQDDIVSETNGKVFWVGVGNLAANLSGGETEVQLTMENDDFEFLNGGYLHLSNKIMTSQTIEASVVIGDSVQLSDGTWNRITSTTDITYPKGCYLGSNAVLSLQDDTHEEWLRVAEKLTTGEVIGTGNGGTNPALDDLDNGTNGICQIEGKLPVVTCNADGGGTLTVYFDQDGNVDNSQGTGASAGKIDMSDGTWETPLVFTGNTASAADVTITYREKPYSYSGNVVTVELDDQVSTSYVTTATTGGMCIDGDTVTASVATPSVTSTGGSFDHTSNPITVENANAISDTITVTFTSGSEFSVAGVELGSLGTGSTVSAFVGRDPENSNEMFSIPNAGWGGSWIAGDTMEFVVTGSYVPIWVKEVVPEDTPQVPHNLSVLGMYFE
jgi:hypothetical protein